MSFRRAQPPLFLLSKPPPLELNGWDRPRQRAAEAQEDTQSWHQGLATSQHTLSSGRAQLLGFARCQPPGWPRLGPGHPARGLQGAPLSLHH